MTGRVGGIGRFLSPILPHQPLTSSIFQPSFNNQSHGFCNCAGHLFKQSGFFRGCPKCMPPNRQAARHFHSSVAFERADERTKKRHFARIPVPIGGHPSGFFISPRGKNSKAVFSLQQNRRKERTFTGATVPAARRGGGPFPLFVALSPHTRAGNRCRKGDEIHQRRGGARNKCTSGGRVTKWAGLGN